ncbi:MAG: AMP-binding protein [Acetobacteraceae bacterium]|nr:AMP-binding protein [Acetobacteraceae bacterium]
MYPGEHALTAPDKPAAIKAETGEVLTYRDLDEQSNRLAQLLHAEGLRPGDHIAVFMENQLAYFAVVWAALRSGLYITAINRYLTADEAAYIANDCGARVLVSSVERAEIAGALVDRIANCRRKLMLGGTVAGWESYEAATAAMPGEKLAEEWLGDTMLYSSGTTGRPKGIKRVAPPARVGEAFRMLDMFHEYAWRRDMVYLSPAPLYHAAPLGFSVGVQRFGGTVVMMSRFDPVEALRLIERHRVTHSQWVPTMFVRMLKLPEEERRGFDLSSHEVAIHAAAPCPVEVKRQMIAWWGPIIHEYYGATEGNGRTALTAEEWLAHPGSVGRAKLGIIHICDDEGTLLPLGQDGLVYFERDSLPFAYHNDPDKTRRAQHPAHPTWTTLGDIGHLDAEGYLYLTDRKAFMIISGGVNIYPQQIEDALIAHPKVHDAAVIGIPNPDLGEEVKAVVEPADGVEGDAHLAEELTDFLKSRVARYMVPKSIDFTEALPRLPTGKLYKAALRDTYRQQQS